MSRPTESKRIEYIDIARAFAIFLTVWGHIARGRIREIIYSFHMPLFFIISGMLLKRRKNEGIADLAERLKRRAFAYYVPYLVWGLFYATLTLKNFLKLCYGTSESIAKTGSVLSLWFLPALLVASVFTECLFFLIRKTRCFDGILSLAMAGFFYVGFRLPHIKPYGWPLAIDIGFVAAGFMLLGYFMQKLLERVRTSIKYVILCIGIMLVLLRVISYGVFPLHKAAMLKGNYGNIPVFLLNVIIESLVVLLFSVLLDLLRLPVNRGMTYIGRNTIGILVVHKHIVIYLANEGTKRGYSMESLPVTAAIAVIGLAISLLISVCVSRLLPELFGKRKKTAVIPVSETVDNMAQ